MYNALTFLTVAAFLPLASAIIMLCWGDKLRRYCAYIATGSIVMALGLSLATLIIWVARPQFNERDYAEAMTYRWLPVQDPPQIRPSEGFNPMEVELAQNLERRGQGLQVGILVDSLTIAMFLAVSTIATFVHVFSIALMGSDPRYHRFLAYLDLVCFAMFGLVLSDNLLQLLAMLELLMVFTWFLTGFSRQRRAPVRAATKGVLVQGIGAAAFMIGTGTLVAQTSIGLSGLTFFAGGPDMVGTSVLDQALLFCGSAPLFLGLSWLTWAGICIFVGAMTMSAQFPLHVWLADAADGPTPALAMTGSITCVAAGAFVVARVYGIFTLDARLFIAVIGCISFAAGALIALMQMNIKRILAFSSVSHLGLVMLFFGVGAYVAALYVLIVHAFCKACLFLSAGSVLLNCRGETQIRRMGGLWKRLPITAGTFLLAMLSLCGTPWLSGFFGQAMGLSLVREYAFALPGRYGAILWWIPFFTMFVTAFYLWRCWWLIFGGKARDPELHENAHENPLMTLVLILLGGLTVIAAYLDIDTIVAQSVPVAAKVISESRPDPLAAISRPDGWFGVFAALWIVLIYMHGLGFVDRIRRLPGVNLLHLWLRENMFLDYLYEGVIVRFIKLIALLCGFVDVYVIDKLMVAAARGVRILGASGNELDTRILDVPGRMLSGMVLLGGRHLIPPRLRRRMENA